MGQLVNILRNAPERSPLHNPYCSVRFNFESAPSKRCVKKRAKHASGKQKQEKSRQAIPCVNYYGKAISIKQNMNEHRQINKKRNVNDDKIFMVFRKYAVCVWIGTLLMIVLVRVGRMEMKNRC